MLSGWLEGTNMPDRIHALYRLPRHGLRFTVGLLLQQFGGLREQRLASLSDVHYALNSGVKAHISRGRRWAMCGRLRVGK